MMRLRYLFINPDLAEMLVKNWEYDQTSLEMFQYFRISANAIYPFKIHGEVCFLRCCPAEEKTRDSILAELEFIDYLRGKGYPALEPVLSKSGERLVEKMTPWGEHYASVFKRVKGQAVEEAGFDDEIMFAYGEALGQLHTLSHAYTAPKIRRRTHLEVFDWVGETLSGLGGQSPALDELRILRDFFSRLPVSNENYGLIHFDFEPDNVYYEPAAHVCSVIDFDDAMYHWYVMDVAKTLDSLEKEIERSVYVHKKALFLAGYRGKSDLDEDLLKAMPLFRRFANLYGYTRVARAMQEQWDNEPDWLVALRTKLAQLQEEDKKGFLEGNS